MDEEWRDIPGLRGYQASSEGRIRNKNGLILKPQNHNKGYPVIMIQLGVHKLVCSAFHGDPPFEGAQVLHGPDPHKGNCRPDNLRWGTSQENSDDTITQGRAVFLKGEEHGRALLTWDIVNTARSRAAAGEPIKKIWRDLGQPVGVEYPAFYKAVRGITWKESQP